MSCLLARAAADLPESVALSWNFDLRGATRGATGCATRYTLSHTEALRPPQWRQARASWQSHGALQLQRAARLPLINRFLRVADAPCSSYDSDW
jgi:hypothetical protein